jgi:Ca2+-binding EF-hand superfamily protein
MSRHWCLLLPVLLISGAALADPPPVKRADVVARAEGTFRIADRDHDGWLSKAEYHNVLAAIARMKGATPTAKGWALVDAHFDAIDVNHTGRISHDRFVGAALEHFDGADLNHDGIVTPDEARKAEKLQEKAAKGR